MNTPSTHHLLVVEDNEDTLLLLQYMLQSSFELHCASTMERALELAGRYHMDLFLLDISLPGTTSGVNLLNQLRTHERYAATPALALTAHALPGDRERFLEDGFDGYVSKPFRRDELTRSIRSTLEGLGPAASRPSNSAKSPQE